MGKRPNAWRQRMVSLGRLQKETAIIRSKDGIVTNVEGFKEKSIFVEMVERKVFKRLTDPQPFGKPPLFIPEEMSDEEYTIFIKPLAKVVKKF